MSKAEYVRRAPMIAGHKCHWPGCEKDVPPAMWGCKPHWFRLPDDLCRRIWRLFRQGQEQDKRPSREYVAVSREAEAFAINAMALEALRPRQADWTPELRNQCADACAEFGDAPCFEVCEEPSRPCDGCVLALYGRDAVPPVRCTITPDLFD